jgi:hypothetical protein
MEISNANSHDWDDFWTQTDETPMTQTEGNVIDRDVLQDRYINKIIDGLDIKVMEQMLYDLMDSDLDKFTCEELIEEVSSSYPELIDESAM